MTLYCTTSPGTSQSQAQQPILQTVLRRNFVNFKYNFKSYFYEIQGILFSLQWILFSLQWIHIVHRRMSRFSWNTLHDVAASYMCGLFPHHCSRSCTPTQFSAPCCSQAAFSVPHSSSPYIPWHPGEFVPILQNYMAEITCFSANPT